MHVPKTIETDRLVLRTPGWEDAGDIFRYASNPEVARFVSWPPHQSIDDSYRFIALMEQRMKEGKLEEYAIFPKDLDYMIGTIGIMGLEKPRVEVGFVIDQPYWGRGYGSEALRAIIHAVFARNEYHRIEALADQENIASWKMMEKCGMKREALMKNYLWEEDKNPSLRHLYLYSILRN